MRMTTAEYRNLTPRSAGEETFAFQCKAMRLPPMEREYQFAKDRGRLWRVDFAFVEYRVAVECEGLVAKYVNGTCYAIGRHTSFDGFRRDALKYATAAILGWSVLRFETSQISDGTAIDFTIELLKAKGWQTTPEQAR